MRALLDVNVLIALLDSEHIHFERAHHWLANHVDLGWASCPITESGCVRILSQPSYSNPVGMADAAARLRETTQTKFHEFWPDSVSVLNQKLIDLRYVHGSKQLTDVYLLALASHHNGRLVTFDKRISLKAVHNATNANLVQI